MMGLKSIRVSKLDPLYDDGDLAFYSDIYRGLRICGKFMVPAKNEY